MDKEEIKANIHILEEQKAQIFSDWLEEMMSKNPDSKYIKDLEVHFTSLVIEIKTLNRRLALLTHQTPTYDLSIEINKNWGHSRMNPAYK
jgi:hypothetical protein